MKQVLAFLIFTATFTNFLITTPAQTAPAGRRPTVGLVLSGGGARGFAHIGVLRVLEANRVPVDYVGGASMGALIGALYSMGRTPDEIEQIISGLDWGRLFQASTSFENLAFRRKEDRRNIPAPVTLKGKINDLKLPNALNSGHEIGLLIDRLTLPYASVTDFSQLPIPFAAVGTDMVNGASVTLDSGSLPRSLRATMSVPGVFAPVELDGRVLADGGLVNNIPTDVVKAMGADIVLVVNIETQIGGRESLESLPGVLAQTINIATVDNSRRSLREADLIISPDLGNLSSSDFSNAKTLIQLGQAGAMEKQALLKPLSLSEADWAEHLAQRRSRQLPETPPVPETVAVELPDADASRVIAEKLNGKYAGQPLDEAREKDLARELSELTGTGRFESLDYQLVDREGKKQLLIGTTRVGGITERPTRLELGLDVNSVESDNVNFNFLARLTLFDIGARGAEWLNDLRLGSNGYLGSEYYYPIRQTKFFVAPRGSYERRRINFFTDHNRIAEYVGQQAQIGIDAGYSFNARSELRAGYTLGYQSFSRRIGDPLLSNISGNFSTVGLRYTYDNLDRAQVPTRGMISRTSLVHFLDSPGSTEPVTQAETNITGFRPYGERNVLLMFGGGGTTFSKTAATLQQFTLGGPFRIGGYGFEEFRGSNYIHAGGGILHNPAIIPSFLGGKTYVGAWYEGGSMFERLGDANYRQSVTGGAIFETPVGAVFIGGSLNENGRGRFYFSFGRIFK